MKIEEIVAASGFFNLEELKKIDELSAEFKNF